jgi:hypothetical protein
MNSPSSQPAIKFVLFFLYLVRTFVTIFPGVDYCRLMKEDVVEEGRNLSLSQSVTSAVSPMFSCQCLLCLGLPSTVPSVTEIAGDCRR